MKTIGAAEFKAKCLALLDEVGKGGQAITVTKRGRPLAVVSRAPKKGFKSPAGSWAGFARITGDIVHGDPEIWECAATKPRKP